MKAAKMIAMLFSLAMLACGSNDGAPLDPAKHLGELTSAEQEQLCDATNDPQGGYGRQVTCSDGSTQVTDKNRDSCLASLDMVAAGCPDLRVGDAVDCSEAIGTELCRFATEPRCKTVRDCMDQFH